MRTHVLLLAGGTALSVALAACGKRESAMSADTTAAADTTMPATTPAAAAATPAAGAVTAVVHNAAGRELGTVTLTESAQGVTVDGNLMGLPPGDHGIHIHMVGKCDGPAFTSAGGHWNPTNHHHGTQNPDGPHFGDLPNLTVGADSMAMVHATTPGGTLRGTNGLLDADGASVVVHAKADDYKTDPSGNSGDRIACGVVVGS